MMTRKEYANQNQVRLSASVARWQADGMRRGYTAGALRLRGQRVGRLVRFLALYPVPSWDAVEEGDLQDWLIWLDIQDISGWTYNGYVMAARAYLHWHIEHEGPLASLGTKDPTQVLPKKRAAIDTVKPLTAAEVSRLLKAPDPAKWVEWRDSILLKLYLDTGLRAREGLWLKLDDIIWDRHLLRIRSTSAKGGRERYVPMTEAVEKALRRWLAKRFAGAPTNCEWVFPKAVLWRTEPQPLTPHGWRARFAIYAKRAGLPVDAHPHSLRHTFAVHFLNQGGDVFSLQAIMGHSSLTTTRRYINPSALEGLVVKARAYSLVARSEGGI